MRARAVRVLAGVTLVVAVAGCSGEARDDGGSRGNEGAATGEPVLIGLINQEGAAGGSFSELREGSLAAVDYVNAELGGLAGRPIELDICLTNGSPESSVACANQMVEHEVVAVRAGVDLGSAASLPVLRAAGIPYLGAIPLLPADFTTDGAFTFDPGGLGNAAGAAFAVDELGATRVSIVHSDDPPGRQLAEAFVKPVLSARGLGDEAVRLVAEKADAADLSAALLAASQGDVDAIIVVFAPPACSRIMQAAGALHITTPMFFIARCGGPAAIEAGGSGADGIYFNSSVLNVEANADDPDVQLYVRKLAQYGPDDIDPAEFGASRGFATTMTIYERLATIGSGAITRESVTEAFRSAVGAASFMGPRYTCDGRQSIATFVSLCSTEVRMYQYVDGHYRDVLRRWVSAGPEPPAAG